MEKIKLLKDLWNKKKGEVIEVSTIRAAFALRKGYAEPVIEKIEKKVADVTRETKIDPELKKRKKK